MRVPSFAGLILSLAIGSSALAAEPLRVFIRAGAKTHGPGQHDHPRFLNEYRQLLAERGMKVDGALEFPTESQIEAADVLVMYAAEGGTIPPEQRGYLDRFLKRGGGIVVIHDAVCGTDPHWFKTIVGGAWEHRHSKWLEGDVGIYVLDPSHPITRDLSNFDFKDEIYYDLHLEPEAKILAASFHSVFNIAPQMWVYEKDNYRAFVCLQGHEYTSFQLPHFRAVLLRGIAWAGKQEADRYLRPAELASLKYPPGGPTAPGQAAQKLVVHPEFDLRLVAAEPLIEKVISLDWDLRGRLWVAETPEYPGGRTINQNDKMVALWAVDDPEKVQAGTKENRRPRDRISRIEDTDGDGVLDRKQVFADGLELITSLVFYRAGVIVAQAPDILWVRDTDQDGQADKIERLYTGFGTFDTHAVINNFRWGLDGWVYSAIGYSAGNPTSPDGSKRFGRVTAGVIRFKPDGSALEQVASGTCNTWGFDFGPDGEAFYTTATCGEHFLHVVMPEKALARGSVGQVRASAVVPDHQRVFPALQQSRQPYVQIDWVGQFTAAAGCCIYQGGAWPERFNGSHFVCEPTVNLVHHELLEPKGVTYAAHKEPGREEAEFIAGTDLWFRPIHSRVGPDGALYVLDFYNQAAVHNDTRGPKHGAHNAAVRPDRDHHLGRIWRVHHKQSRVLPDVRLDPSQPKELVRALEHPNGWTRMTAHRLLAEGAGARVTADLARLLRSNQPGTVRVHALWLLEQSGQLDRRMRLAALEDKDPVIRKNALRLVAESAQPADNSEAVVVLKQARDPDARVRLQALIALGTLPVSREVAQALVEIYPSLNDRHLESAVIGVASRDPLLVLETVLRQGAPSLEGLAGQLARQIALKQDAVLAAKTISVVAAQGAGADRLKQAALENLAQTLKPDLAVEWSGDLQAAFGRILAAPEPGLAEASLPLIARWDQNGRLAGEVKPLIDRSMQKLGDRTLSDDQRGRVAVNLLGVRRLDPEIVGAVGGLLTPENSAALQKRVIEALGNTPDPRAGQLLAGVYPQLDPELRNAAFAQLIKRPDWSRSLLEAVQQRKIDLLLLGPASVHRLRTHPDPEVARLAVHVIDEIRGPEQKEKETLVAQFTPAVLEAGNIENGKRLYTENCANCHKFKGEGRDLAPDMTGMGAHGPVELLRHILDPNRVVEPNFVSVSIETKDDQVYDGVVARENRSAVQLRNATGDFEIRQDNIQRRRSTGLSLMPNGFESLGGDGLRDLLAYLAADEKRYRILDLTPAFSADSSRGIFASQESVNESLQFTRFGIIRIGQIPFEIVSPQKSPTGNNVLVLKGGSGFSATRPQRAEVKLGVPAVKLHFLGGVGGWAWPCCGDEKNEGLPVAKVTLHYADGLTEELILKNGVEFADYIGKFDVPGSQEALELVRHGQVRWFTKPVGRRAVISRISIESFNNRVAPAFVGITAELPEDSQAPGSPASIPAPADEPRKMLLTLIVGGGTHHDFDRWFNREDSATIQSTGKAAVSYTDQPENMWSLLRRIDVLYLCANQPMTNSELRQGILDLADRGRGLLLVHPALWYNWSDWPKYNQILVGGGARSHDKLGEFEVTLEEPDHPILEGVPKTFRIRDELYHFAKDAHGTPIQVLATGKSPETGKTFPVAWITKHPRGRIVCLTLGHDGSAHQHPAYKKLLQNSLLWAAGRSGDK